MSDEALLARLVRLETESAVRRTVARYFQICDRLGPDTPFEELGALFTEDARWEGHGRYRDAFGGYRGRAAIVGMIRGYCLPEPHFAMTAHFFSAEHILVTGDTAAQSEWMMLQTSTYADGRADLRSASLAIDFAHEDEAWRIARFTTRNLFSRRIDHWTDAADIPVPCTVSHGASQ